MTSCLYLWRYQFLVQGLQMVDAFSLKLALS